MADNSANNKRIAKNTIFLYVRMLIIMIVNLYTVRAFLDILGVTDYGIYNVVGGIVTMFTFLNNTLATSSQRYFSVELAKGNLKRVNQWLSLNVTIFAGMAIGILLILETFGLWFLNTELTIPDERLYAANIVYQISLLTFAANMFTVPYNALIVAHERMSAFAYISIVEALLKLIVVGILLIISYDKLIVYALLLMVSAFGITASYIVYCVRNFSESKFIYYWNKAEAMELFSFSGWHFLGTISMAFRSQGINILINMFFNPTINAARAVSYQILNALTQLSANFFTAVKPQIYKSYAEGDLQSMYKLIFRSTIMCIFLVSIITFPILANTEFVLGLWLKEIPEYTVIFTQLILINGLIDSTNGPTIAAALATGEIRKYEIVVALLIFLNLPISYIALVLGYDATITIIISIIISIVTALARSYMLQKMIGIPFKMYTTLFTKLLLASGFIWCVIRLLMYNTTASIWGFVSVSIIIVLLVILLYFYFVLDKSDRYFIVSFVKNKISPRMKL